LTNTLRISISNQIEALTDPANSYIKDEITSAIKKKKDELESLEDELVNLRNTVDEDKEKFLKFALDFADNMGNKFLELTPENRLKCKQLIFPGGFYVDKNNKVYTPEISPLYSLRSNKKASAISSKALLVQHR
jgi:predicted AlkP superfamily phosphohydrolase/phosphomutase